jgi:hypothetical protein
MRNYVINRDGVNFENKKGKLSISANGDILLDFNDNKIERLSIKDGKLMVDHFDPKSSYPNKVGCTGTGVR